MERIRREGGWRALLLLLGIAAFFYAPILLGLRTLPDGDFTHHFLPFSLFLQQEVLEGRLPLWNPYTYSGHPFLADVQAAVFYPVSGLLLALTLPFTDAAARLYFLQVEAIVQVALGGWFTYLLARRLTGRHDAGLIAAICFAFSGYLTGYPVVQLAVLRTAIWLPLILWLMVRTVEAPQRWERWVLVGATGAVALLAGHSQTFLYVGYTALAWMLLLLIVRWRQHRSLHELGAALMGMLLAAAVFVGLSAPQLLPSLEYVQRSVRADVDYAYVSGGFPLQDSWQLLLPGVLTYYSPLYIGVIGLGLAFVAVGAALLRSHWLPDVRRGATASASSSSGGVERDMDAELVISHRVGVLFFLGLALVALLLSYGGNGFLYPIFYRFAPGFDLFRGQERAAYLVAFGLSVLAGYGMLSVRVLPQAVRAWLATLYAALAIGAVYVFGLLWQLPERTAIGSTRFLLLATLAIGLAAGFALLLRLPGWSRQRTQLLMLLVFASLFWANFTTNIAPFSPARKTALAPEMEAVQRAVDSDERSTQSRSDAEQHGDTKAGQAAPGRVYNEFRVYEDYGMRVGVEDVWGASPLRLARYARLFKEFPLDRMWRLTGVEHVLTWRRELFVPSTLLAEFPQQTDTTYLHRLAAPNPRAWLATEVVVADDDAAVTLLADHGFDLDRKAILSSEADVEIFQEASKLPGRLEGDPASARVTLRTLAPGRVEVSVASETPGLLVVSENWMPGWRVVATRWPASVEAPLIQPLRANLTLLGVPVPAGESTIELRYEPASVRIGLWSGAATLGALIGAAGFTAWRTRRQRSTP
jgi:hypothetical protein